MALPSTIHRFRLDVSDVDRGVYETVELQLARHPSETVAFALTRVLAYALELREGLAFGRGIGFPEEPALSTPDAYGGVALWIDVGAPSAERLHKASKLAGEVAVYTHKDIDRLVADLSARRIHEAERIRIVGVPAAVLDALEARLERSNAWTLLRTDGHLYVTAGAETFEGRLDERSLG